MQKENQKNSAEKLELEKKRLAIEEQEMHNTKDYNDKIINKIILSKKHYNVSLVA